MSDYNFLMETRLSPEQFQVVNHLSRVAADQRLNIFLVGGAVRDLMYGQQIIRDLDFAVEGRSDKIVHELKTKPRRRGEPAPLSIVSEHYDSHLDSTELVLSNGVRCEISMARAETYSRPGKRPEVQPTTIFEDLRRRDFSVNAMAVSLHPNSRGLLLDPTNGAADIERRELRALHSRSFSEDPKRIYRLLRLGLRLHFKAEERTEIWLKNALGYRVWTNLDPAQQGRELRAIMQEDQPARILKELSSQGLLAGLDRKLASRRLPYEQFAKIRSVVQTVPGADAFLLNFHCLVAKLGGTLRTRMAHKIIGDRKMVKKALAMEGEAKKLARVLGSSRAKLPSQVYGILNGKPQHLLLFLLVNYPQRKIQTRIKSFLFKFPVVRARIPRAELLTLGLEAGPKSEKIFHQLVLAQLDGKIKTHQQLLKEFRALAGIKEPPPPKPPVTKRALVKAIKAAKAARKPPKARPPKPRKALARKKGKPSRKKILRKHKR